MRITKTISIPDRTGPGSTTTASSAVNLQGTVEIGLLLVKDKEEEERSRYKEKEIRARLEVLV